jgi:mannose PTS system EIIA component
MNGILIVAHAPLAHALRQCALHVFPECGESVLSVDVQPHLSPEESLASVRASRALLATRDVVILADLFGATPCNVAQRLMDGVHTRVVTGVNLPMLLRSISYQHESLDDMVARAVAGGTQGMLQLAVTTPQNQTRKNNHDQNQHDHQQ